jgi:hypothetical protein
MKNVVKLLRVITFTSIITFAMTSCGDGPGGGGNGGAGAGSAFSIYDEAGNKYTLTFSGSGRSARAVGNDNNQGNDNSQGKRGDNYTIIVTGPGGNTIGTNEGKIGNVEGGGIFELTQDSGGSLNVETTKEGRILRFPKVIRLGNGKLHEVNGYLSHDGQKVQIEEVTVPGGGLYEKLAWIHNNVQSNTRYTVTVDRNETVASDWPTYFYLPGKSNVIILLKGTGAQTISSQSRYHLFETRCGITLELEDVTLQGNGGGDLRAIENVDGAVIMKGSSKVANGGINVWNGSLIMKDNAENYGAGGTYSIGGVFTMQDNAKVHDCGGVGGGIFTMNGGEIYNNDYRVNISERDVFIMNGGKIYNNTAPANLYGQKFGGGVFVGKGGSFTMNGGEISGNTADVGGGVYVAGGAFTMNGGTISRNTSVYNGGGVNVDYHEHWDGTLTGGSFTMNGGTISGNTTANSGGGVDVGRGGTFRITNGTIYGSNEVNTALKNNVASYGIGAALFCASPNTAQYGNGGKWADLPLTYNNGYYDNNEYTDNTIKVVNGVLQ